MNVERRSSRKKRETMKVREAKDELLKKQSKKNNNDKNQSKKTDKKSNTPSISIDDETSTTPAEVLIIDEVKNPSVSLDEGTVMDQDSPGINKISSDQQDSFTSEFTHNTLEELFNFVYDNKKSIVGQGDLRPEDFDHYSNDPVKEENSTFLGEKFVVSKTRTYYEAMLIDGVVYRVFDNVVLTFDEKYQHLKPNVAKIIAFYEENSKKRVTLEFYYKPSDMLPTMKKIRLTGRHPLIPVSDDSHEINPANSTKKKRGRPPNKRLFNVEETIKALESATEYEIYTSLKPYVDDLSVAAIGEKCNVEHLQPNAPVPTQDSSIKTFFYKRTLEFKICALTFCKPRPTKPRQWIEILEKKNRDIRSHSRRGDLMSPKINGYEKKKKKRKVEKIPSDDIGFDSHLSDDMMDDEINLYDYSDDTDILTSPPHHEFSDVNELQSSLYNKPLSSQNIGQKMELIGNTITKRLEQIEKMIEIMNTDVQMSLEEIKSALMETKKDNNNNNNNNFQVPETSVLPDEFINLGGSSYQDSVFINQQFL